VFDDDLGVAAVDAGSRSGRTLGPGTAPPHRRLVLRPGLPATVWPPV